MYVLDGLKYPKKDVYDLSFTSRSCTPVLRATDITYAVREVKVHTIQPGYNKNTYVQHTV